jgi:hypothetical protein
MDSMLITSLNRSKLKKAQVESPLERIIKYWYTRLSKKINSYIKYL